MKSGVLAAALLLLTATGVRAEQRHHAPPSPPPAPTQQAPVVTPGLVFPQTPLIPAPTPAVPPATPFDARPGTYAPHYNDPNPRSGYGIGVPYYPGAVGIGEYAPASAAPAAEQKPPAAAPAPEPAPAPSPAPEVPRVAAVHPDTFYVIPGCYAGNRPPKAARLPKGCDPSRLVEIPVR